MAKRRKRSIRDIEDLPSLFDSVSIDMSMDISSDAPRTAPSRPQREETTAVIGENDGITRMSVDAMRRPNTLRFISFGSGSSGNCAYLGDDLSGFLIDAGVDNNRIDAEIARNGLKYDNIRGIILTHDHSDHVRFAYSLLRRHPHMRLYCTPKNLTGLLRRHNISRRIKDYHVAIYREFPFTLDNFVITPFETLHDGTDNMGFDICINDRHFVVATDMGAISERADHYMRQANYLMIESNYDNHMLQHGRYPEYLKARIRGEKGHMDNKDTAQYISEIWNEALTHIFLCHLSHDNNTPSIALDETRRLLVEKSKAIGNGTGSVADLACPVQLTALPRFESSPLTIIRI